MILKALYDYYNRCVDYGEVMPKLGYRLRKIAFTIVIDENGNFVDIEDNRFINKDGKPDIQKHEVVREKPRTSNEEALFLWDKAEYLLNINFNKKTIEDEYNSKCSKFIDICKHLYYKYPHEKILKAIVSFYDNKQLYLLKDHEKWEDIISNNTYYYSFKLKGETYISGEIEYLKDDVREYDIEDNNSDYNCLVTGQKCAPVRIWLSVPLPFSGTNKPRLISFQEGQGYDSYGKIKGFNAPVDWSVSEKISISLEHLLDNSGKYNNSFTIGKRTFIFWSSSKSEISRTTEDSLKLLLSKGSDDPNVNLEDVISTFMSIYSGKQFDKSDDKFYILGLTPNKSRIAVVYWRETTVYDFAKMLLKHFKDMEIGDGRNSKPYFGLYHMMSSVTLKNKNADNETDNTNEEIGQEKKKDKDLDKDKDIQSNLPEATMRSIIEGCMYPYSLFSSAIHRIRSDVSRKDKNGKLIEACKIGRAAIIKAYLNRINDNNNKKLEIMLDKQNNNLGYVCGRLFAVLEYTQNTANKNSTNTVDNTSTNTTNKNSTIRERYMNSASSTPAAVFATLLNLNVHHVENIEEKWIKKYIENMKEEIVDLLPADGFPAHLDLQDQGRFFVGYYHQKRDLYTKKEKDIQEQQSNN